jgi:hypothetical protein
MKLDAGKRQRIYVINEEGNLHGLITLRDIIAKLVHEPPGYFGDFFNSSWSQTNEILHDCWYNCTLKCQAPTFFWSQTNEILQSTKERQM